LLNKLTDWFAPVTDRRRPTVRRSPARPARVRPSLEALEDRLVPAITYHGGPLLTHVDVNTVFYGQNWSTDDPTGNLRNSLIDYQKAMVQSPYLTMLGEYGVGRGSFGAYDPVYSGPKAGDTVTETQIQGMLLNEIAGKRLAYTPRELYFVYLPPNVRSAWDQVSSFNPTGSYGHHGSFNFFGSTVYYAVIQHPSVYPYGIGGLNTFQQLTEVSSHELAEAVTDPDVRLNDTGVAAGSQGGWFDSDKYVVWHSPLGWVSSANPHYQQEIGDYVNLQYDTFVANGTPYTVQKEWSNLFGKGILANGAQSYMTYYPVAPNWFNALTYHPWTNGGRAANYYSGVGMDGRTYLNYWLNPSELGGWFTIN